MHSPPAQYSAQAQLDALQVELSETGSPKLSDEGGAPRLGSPEIDNSEAIGETHLPNRQKVNNCGLNGRFKRSNIVVSSNETKIRVYLHPVKPDDTLAGIQLLYNVPDNVLRKANRLWPSDTIKMVNALFIPVDECTISPSPLQNQEENCPRLDISHRYKIDFEQYVSVPRVGPVAIIQIYPFLLNYFPKDPISSTKSQLSRDMNPTPRDSMESNDSNASYTSNNSTRSWSGLIKSVYNGISNFSNADQDISMDEIL